MKNFKKIERIDILMMKENKRENKLCLFFASDYHFEMISLPYINESLKKNENVIIMTENNLDSSVDKVISSINLNEEERNRLTRVDWKNDNLDKFRKIKIANQEGKDTLIFVKGKENYINNMNKNIENWINNNEVTVVDCYDISEIQDEVSDIAKRYDRILSTSGVEKLL